MIPHRLISLLDKILQLQLFVNKYFHELSASCVIMIKINCNFRLDRTRHFEYGFSEEAKHAGALHFTVSFKEEEKNLI